MNEVRPWRHRWRPEDLAVLLAGAEFTTHGRAAGPQAAGSRTVAATGTTGPAGAFAKSNLPNAYRGAPYYQPRPPPRRQRALRRLILALMLVEAVVLVIITGTLLVHGSMP